MPKLFVAGQTKGFIIEVFSLLFYQFKKKKSWGANLGEKQKDVQYGYQNTNTGLIMAMRKIRITIKCSFGFMSKDLDSSTHVSSCIKPIKSILHAILCFSTMHSWSPFNSTFTYILISALFFSLTHR